MDQPTQPITIATIEYATRLTEDPNAPRIIFQAVYEDNDREQQPDRKEEVKEHLTP